MKIHRFYVNKKIYIDKLVKLNSSDTNHIKNVLRLKQGDLVNIVNGEEEFKGRIVSLKNRGVIVEILEHVKSNNISKLLELNLFQAIIRPNKLDELVRIHTELGVDNFYPVFTKYCALEKKIFLNRIDRWKKISIAAIKQCGRINIMNIHSPIELIEAINIAKKLDFVIVLEVINKTKDTDIIYIEDLVKLIKQKNALQKIAVFIGPEGGFAQEELNLFKENNFNFCCISNNILRSETASVSIITLLKFIEISCIA